MCATYVTFYYGPKCKIHPPPINAVLLSLLHSHSSFRVLLHLAMAMAQALPRWLLSGPLHIPPHPHAHLRCARAPLLSSLRLRNPLSVCPLPPLLRGPLPSQPCATTAPAEVDLPSQDDDAAASAPTPPPETLEEFQSRPMLAGWMPPRYLWRAIAAFIIAGQVPPPSYRTLANSAINFLSFIPLKRCSFQMVVIRTVRGRVHVRNTLQQLELVGPRSLGVSLLTASFVGMVFTIQFVREFARLGLTRSVGGVLALALARELSPVVTAIIMAGRVGSAFAAELGTMQVSEQTDTLRVLRTDPVDYLVTPRVIACCLALPILTTMCFAVAMAASVLLADSVYNVSANIILESAARALQPWDLISTTIKSVVFGGIISIVSCTWGVTTLGGAKGVGESTTSAVVISLVCIFIADFILSWVFFQGAGDALKAAMG
ncbi:hypothetical protein KC19_6G222600 [Ceratodon purpureus]|uniref:Protein TRIGALACTOSYLDIACYLGLYCEROL 1, chloroplastic n=1 Tax=Ceratodon purpureus TaxID=3225 RepID=A0A8T0HKA9_CERPU|nr:hypothetical protein KC19_6G222600 [Ceratodon purpureus]